MVQHGFHKAAMAELVGSTKHGKRDLPFGGGSKVAHVWKSTANGVVVWLVF